MLSVFKEEFIHRSIIQFYVLVLSSYFTEEFTPEAPPLNESSESQLLADLKHMQTAALIGKTAATYHKGETTGTPFYTTLNWTWEPTMREYWWQGWPETPPSTQRSTYMFSARSHSLETLTETTTQSTMFRFTEKPPRLVPEQMLGNTATVDDPIHAFVGVGT